MNISSVTAAVNSFNQNNISTQSENNDFSKILNDLVSDANNTDFQDKASNINLMLGEAENTHDTMIAAEKADLSLRLTIQIRNKIIDAYTEVMRMQI